MDNDSLVSRFSSHLLRSPARMSIMRFALLIAMGTALLILPASAAGPPMLCLYLWTAPTAGWGQAAYPAVYHAVSAFCNAGFSLYRDSFVGYREDWMVCVVLSVLIVIGSIGFVVIADLKNRFLNRKATIKRLSLHSRLALSASALLILM